MNFVRFLGDESLRHYYKVLSEKVALIRHNLDVTERTLGDIMAEMSRRPAFTCQKCRHYWHFHEVEITLGDRTVYECNTYTGMGDWCGCAEKKP